MRDEQELRYTDYRRDEQERKMSLKCTPMTFLLPDSNEKSYLFNLIDTPGHPNFSDEVTAAMRLSDSMLILVDCIEGVTFYTERLIREALNSHLQILIVLNKIDKLVLELKFPPDDAYHKLKHTLDEINYIIHNHPFINKDHH